MSKKPLFIFVIILLITNIITLLMLNKNEDVLLDDEEIKIASSEPVASIGKEDIYYEDWISLLRKDYGEQHLKKLIDHTVVKQLAQQKDIQINEKLIDQEIALLTTMQGIIRKDKIADTEKKWREDVLYRYQLEALLAEDIVISEEDIQHHYDEYQKQYNFMSSMQFSHIVVENFDVAEKVIKELDEGASFNLLALEYSSDEVTKDEGGYLGYFTKTSQFLPAGYYDMATSMEEHAYSEPFQTDNGVAVIYLHRELPGITFTYDEVKDQIKRELALNKSAQILTANPLWERLEIEWIYDPLKNR